MKMKVEKPIEIADGVHEGMIVDVRYRTEPFAYTDLIIEMSNGLELTAGYPTKMMEQSKLGQLMKRFGFIVADGLEVDPDSLENKPCKFITMTETTKKGKFAKIISDSVVPNMLKEETVSGIYL
jgi:hypothetical protein